MADSTLPNLSNLSTPEHDMRMLVRRVGQTRDERVDYDILLFGLKNAAAYDGHQLLLVRRKR